ncbi:hypothetical protein PMKS-002381 [Pichia membranifaciens]|uniref:Uncharacterized protein n=1 Tax=Pichia membranifaciens TaxID=4926 RepID=A0A1Q2YHP3_9ASCO|nr:hypothetical protein PMKS-002381 [Pichia membranifaciens]
MTTRTVNNFKTLREILDYNDILVQERNNLQENHEEPTTGTNAGKTYTLKKTTALSVLNWDAVFSNQKVFACMMLMLITVLSQLVFSYVTFALVNVQQSLGLFYLSQALNLFFSYVMPLSLIKELDEVFESPVAQLSSEIEIYRQLKISVMIYCVCAIVSTAALASVFSSGPFIELRYNLQELRDVPVDLTSFVRVLQIISFQLTLINLMLCSINLYITDRKIRRCFNRIERLQDRADLEIMFNENLIEQRFDNNFF